MGDLATIFSSMLLMSTDAGAEGTGGGGLLQSILLFGGIILIFYFLMIRPQRKREKKEKDMRNSLEIGDGVVTIGGIVGRVVSIKDEVVLIETSSDRTKMRVQRWAIQTVEKLNLEE